MTSQRLVHRNATGLFMPAILDGITVLDLSIGPAAALATMMLSDQGARVIRVVEHNAPIFRDGGFIVWDRGKERMTLDFDRDVDVFKKLVAGADVLVEDFAPSSTRQVLVNSKNLESINPRLISCSLTAYGKRGALKDEPPIEDLVLARMLASASLLLCWRVRARVGVGQWKPA